MKECLSFLIYFQSFLLLPLRSKKYFVDINSRFLYRSDGGWLKHNTGFIGVLSCKLMSKSCSTLDCWRCLRLLLYTTHGAEIRTPVSRFSHVVGRTECSECDGEMWTNVPVVQHLGIGHRMPWYYALPRSQRWQRSWSPPIRALHWCQLTNQRLGNLICVHLCSVPGERRLDIGTYQPGCSLVSLQICCNTSISWTIIEAEPS